MGIFFTYNDKIYKAGENIISADSRALRYGDGLFETMKVSKGRIQLHGYHFERLFSGIQILQFKIPEYFTAAHLQNKIAELCTKNSTTSSARIRLMIFRSDGGLYDLENNYPDYLIQTWSIDNESELNSNGLIIDIYPDAKKSCDVLANIKSNNFLPYAMAALYAKKIKVNDCLLLNNYDRICDSTIANIFLIKDDIIYTPPLTEGCVAGIIRRFIIERLQPEFKIIEKPLLITDLENADEVFLTNSIKSIRWVKQFRNTKYKNHLVKKIFTQLQQLLL